MLIIWIGLGAVLLFAAQAWIYSHYWEKGLSAELLFSRESAVEGEECLLLERVENRKLLPLPMLKVKFQVSRTCGFPTKGTARSPINITGTIFCHWGPDSV